MPSETGWRRCVRCQVLHYPRELSHPPRACPYGGRHKFSDEEYSVVHHAGADYGQTGWRKCYSCSDLFFSGGMGVCSTGLPHNDEWGGDYVILHRGESDPSGGQVGWRWCQRCMRLFYAAGEGGLCGDGKTAHDGSVSGRYAVTTSTPQAPMVVLTGGEVTIGVTVTGWNPTAIAAWDKANDWAYVNCILKAWSDGDQIFSEKFGGGGPQQITSDGQRFSWTYRLPKGWGLNKNVQAEVFFTRLLLQSPAEAGEPRFSTVLRIPIKVVLS